MTQQNKTDLTWGAHLPECVWVYGEAEHVLKLEDVMEDWHMRTQVVDEFVRPEPELDIGVQVYELLEVVLSDLLTKIEFSPSHPIVVKVIVNLNYKNIAER